MLKFLRNKKHQKKIYMVLALAIIPAFALWGVLLTAKDSQSSMSLGVIAGKKISIEQYLASYKAVQHEIALRYGENAKDVAEKINLKGEAWDRLLLLHYAQQQKIRVKDREVVEWLTRQPIFSPAGRFDSNFYKLYVSRYLRMSTREFEEEMRQLLVIEKIRERFSAKIHLKDAEIEKLLLKKSKKEKLVFNENQFRQAKARIKAVLENRKSAKAMRTLLGSLRNELQLNLDAMKKLFPEDETLPALTQ